MKRVLSLILITCVVLSLGTLIARRIGAAQPPSSFAMMFTNPDGTPCKMPCMFGIRVGETTADQAYALLQAHPSTRKSTQLPDQPNSTILSAELVVSLALSEEKKVMGIEISYPQKQTLGDAVVQLKQPDGINFDEYGRLFYYADNIVIFFDRGITCDASGQCSELGFDPETDIRTVAMRAGKSWMRATYPVRNWLGFGSMTRYFPPTPQP